METVHITSSPRQPANKIKVKQGKHSSKCYIYTRIMSPSLSDQVTSQEDDAGERGQDCWMIPWL